jgi:CheY-like chemotaxis protein
MANRILFLEHDEDDIYITRSFLNELNIPVQLEVVTSPDAAESMLAQSVRNGERLPDLFLMDYNAVPENTGKFIGRLTSNFHFCSMPVIVLRGTSDPAIVRECYANGASSFIEKPADSEEIRRKISVLIDYWFSCVVLPS